jgi:FKBP-type peptidyl-prolyl cis-trans isomerase SlyD
MQFQATTEAGPRLVTVVKVVGEEVTVDGNHPLAGVTLKFDVNVRDVRDATAEEISHGHPHRPGTHDQ